MKNIILSVVVCAVLLTGCSFFKKKPVVITMFNYKMEYSEQFNKIAETFSEKYKGKYKIEIESVPYEAYLVLEANLNSNKSWDIMMMPPYNAVINNAKKGYLLDLTNEKFVSAVNNKIISAVSYDGKVYAMPYGLNVFGLFYNKQIFSDNNLIAPSSWSDLKDICVKLKDNSVVPFSVAGKEDWCSGYLFFMLLSSSMGDDFDKWVTSMNNGLSSFNIAKVDSVFDIIDFYKDNGGSSVNNTNFRSQIKNFADGRSAMLFQGFQEYANAESDMKFDAGIIPFPVDDGDKQKLCTDIDFSFAVSSNVDEKKMNVVRKFLEHLIGDDTINYLSKESRIIFAVNTNVRSGVYLDIDKILQDGGENIVSWGNNKVPPVVFEESKKAVKEYINGKTTRASVIKKLDEVWSSQLVK